MFVDQGSDVSMFVDQGSDVVLEKELCIVTGDSPWWNCCVYLERPSSAFIKNSKISKIKFVQQLSKKQIVQKSKMSQIKNCTKIKNYAKSKFYK